MNTAVAIAAEILSVNTIAIRFEILYNIFS